MECRKMTLIFLEEGSNAGNVHQMHLMFCPRLLSSQMKRIGLVLPTWCKTGELCSDKFRN